LWQLNGETRRGGLEDLKQLERRYDLLVNAAVMVKTKKGKSRSKRLKMSAVEKAHCSAIAEG
jgi:hypothetical protein